jgi:hypothetical protein
MSCAVAKDIEAAGGRIQDWTMWDPAAGSGRLYEQFPKNNRYASDLRGTNFQFMPDAHFYPGVNFLEHVIQPLTKRKQIYMIANPPYGDLTHQFINRAFDGTYPVKRALFLVSGGANLARYLSRIDYSRCVLVKKSKTFTPNFELMLEPRQGGAPVYRAIKQKVQLLLFYSIKEFGNILNTAAKGHLCTPILQRGPCHGGASFADAIRLDPATPLCKAQKKISPSNQNTSASPNMLLAHKPGSPEKRSRPG